MPKERNVLEKNNRRRERKKIGRRMCYLLSFVLFLCILSIIGIYKKVEASSTIYIETQDLIIYQDDKMPIFITSISAEGDTDYLLDVKSGYSVASLVSDLNKGKGLEVECTVYETYQVGEGFQEGEYLIEAHLSEEYQQKFKEGWSKNVKIKIKDGNLKVLNTSGYWEDDIFLSWKGEPLTNQWIKSEGILYYLDSTGTKVVDTQVQMGMTLYTFDSEGQVSGTERHIDPDKPMIALTFDDGPGDYTMELLQVLEEYDAAATFFMQGVNIQENDRETLLKMVEIGCELGNHSTYHPDLTTLTASEIEREINITSAKIEELAGTSPTVFRPPYGAWDSEVKETVGFPIILWNVDTLDWKTNSSEVVLEHVLSAADDGDIILMHDTKAWSVAAMIEAVPTLIERGYQLVTISELAQYNGVELEIGEPYYFFK